MGFNWRRAGRAVATAGLSETLPAAGIDVNPGPNGNDPIPPGQEHRTPDQLRWDPTTGMPINAAGPPANEVALQYQYKSQELIRQRQQALWGDAANVLGQGADLLQSYRPGGSAALASGIYGQRANVYQNQAASLTEPDLMSIYREDKQIQAERAARRARNLQIGLGIAQMGASLIGGGMAGGAAAGGLSAGQGLGLAQMGQPVQGGGVQAGPGIATGGVYPAGTLPQPAPVSASGPYSGGYQMPATAMATAGPSMQGSYGAGGAPPAP